MTIDMKFFNVYYFCHLANESMGKFDYASTNAEFTERQFEIEPEEFPPISVLREYCSWLIDRIFYEQANSIANSGEVADFNPINWINQAVLKYKGIDVLLNNEFKSDNEDYLETYNKYIEYLDRFVNGVFCKHFLDKIAKHFWTLLHVQIGQSCKALAGHEHTSHEPLQTLFSC